MFELSTHWIHTWATEAATANETTIDKDKVCDRFADLDSYKDLLEEIHEDFLEDAFGPESRISREKFLDLIEKNCSYLFSPE